LNHPPQHKHAAIRYVYNRLNTYHLQNDEYGEEFDTIHIMLNNGFPVHTHNAPTPRQPTMTLQPKTDTTTQEWAPFTYIGRETTFITNFFKKTDLGITLRTNNSLQKLLMPKPQTLDKYNRSRAYKLTCPDCNKVYVGQMGRNFAQRYKEHKNAFRSNSNTSKCAKHVPEL